VPLTARALDARGHAIAGVSLEWNVDDSSVAELDSVGVLTGRNAGRTMITAKVGDISGQSGVTVITTASALALVAGADQRVPAGSTLPQPIVVRATNRRGAPAAGQVVTFRLVSGHGAIQPMSVVTDADGRARATWTLGDDPGRQMLLANVAKVDAPTEVVAEADPIASNARVAALSERLSGRAGETLADSVAVRVTDSSGRALPDVPVRWIVESGGHVEAIAPRTDSLGVARAQWTLAKRTGTQRVRAEVGRGSGARGIAPVTISATALAGAPAGVVVVSGDNQRAAAGATLSKAIVFKVVDANGSGVANAALVLSPSGGSLPDSALHTDSLGVARVRWTMGHAAKDYSLAAHVDGVKTLFKVAAHAAPSAAANLSFDDAPATARRSRESARHRRLFVLVTDVYGNPVPDTKVSFKTKSGVVTPARAATDQKGRAALSWTLGSKPGDQTLTGAVRGSDVTGAYVTEVGGHEAPPRAVSKKTPARHGA
jgi:hypothetical protein